MFFGAISFVFGRPPPPDGAGLSAPSPRPAQAGLWAFRCNPWRGIYRKYEKHIFCHVIGGGSNAQKSNSTVSYRILLYI
jgi:hypothetical protein